ncbi:HpcH/HpaI aldolase family protein [Agrobacterium rosae]|uniref:HpcH/HpaI aldolase family protein n=1 Tax=Agrobacterium rosae TaxID=1972867 RepID=UPI003A808EEA
MIKIGNRFKEGLSRSDPQLGLWVSLCNVASAEIATGSGADWLLVDMEHAPNEISTVADQLRAVGEAPSVIVRPPTSEPVITKRLLDIGVKTLMFPMIDTAAQARAAVSWTRYPPGGKRGISSVVRASNYGRDTSYVGRTSTEICVIVQAETPLALENIDEIAAVAGIDAIFIGPGDLAASMGYIGQTNVEPVQRAIGEAITRINNAGKGSGVLAYGHAAATRAIGQGAGFVAVGADTWILARETSALVESCRSGFPAREPEP